MSEQKKENENDVLTMVCVILGTIAIFFFKFVLKAVIRKKTWTQEFIISWACYLLGAVLIVFSPRWNVPALLHLLSPNFLNAEFAEWIYLHIPRWWQVGILFFTPFLTFLFGIGIFEWIKMVKYQKGIDHLGLKTSTGLIPKVKNVIEMDNNQKKILVQAIGIDVAELRSKKGSLESSFNAIVQDVRVAPYNKQLVEIIIAEKELATLIRFEEVADRLKKPYTCLIGESFDQFIVADFCEIHHMLVAGATGGGKSYFFKQLLVSLLKCSDHIQLYLIDLKRGVEMRPFDILNNVKVVKENIDAVILLEAVVKEMDRRFKILEDIKVQEINPKRDKLDRIFVGIDEASELFIVSKTSKEAKDNANRARELTDKIAKLGRAAGIHLILATQKVVKETIDTNVQTNINARVIFRVNTMASSMTVLGNKKAAELPQIKGRAIWSVGSQDIIVQVPKLDADEMNEELGALTTKFNSDTSPFFGLMISPEKKQHKPGKGFVKKSYDEDAQDGLEENNAD